MFRRYLERQPSFAICAAQGAYRACAVGKAWLRAGPCLPTSSDGSAKRKHAHLRAPDGQLLPAARVDPGAGVEVLFPGSGVLIGDGYLPLSPIGSRRDESVCRAEAVPDPVAVCQRGSRPRTRSLKRRSVSLGSGICPSDVRAMSFRSCPALELRQHCRLNFLPDAPAADVSKPVCAHRG